MTLGINQSEQEQGELLWPRIETSKMADLSKDDILKLIQLQTVLLPYWFFSSLSDSATSAPAAKQYQIRRLAWWTHFDNLSSVLRMCHIWNGARWTAVCVLLMYKSVCWSCVSVALLALSLGADACRQCAIGLRMKYWPPAWKTKYSVGPGTSSRPTVSKTQFAGQWIRMSAWEPLGPTKKTRMASRWGRGGGSDKNWYGIIRRGGKWQMVMRGELSEMWKEVDA